jgi:tetratricopeptide (TPR) repeat protein
VPDKLVDKLIELISGGFFFEYPALIPVTIVVLTVIFFAYLYYKYLWDEGSVVPDTHVLVDEHGKPLGGEFPDYKRGKRRFDLWRSIIVASAAVALVLSLIGWLGYRYWGLPTSFADDQIGILVAEVPDQTNREQQLAYQNALRLHVQSNPELRETVKVRLIERPLPPDAEAQQAEAVKIGRWLRAAFVLRPFIVEGTQEPWLTVVNPENMFQPESSLGKFSSPQLATLDTLSLPEDLTQLAEVALALALSKRHSYKEAAQILADVLKSKHLPEAASSRWALNLLRGNNLLLFGSFTIAAAEYQEAIHLKPDYVEAYTNLGAALALQGQYADAIAEYQKAIRLKPDYAPAHNNLGGV